MTDDNANKNPKIPSVLTLFVIPVLALVLTFYVVTTFFNVEVEAVPVSETSGDTTSGQALIGEDFTLTNQFGEAVSSKDFRGKYMLVYFGFTHCPGICPTDLAIMSEALQQLDEEELAMVEPVFITIDPERDTVEQMKGYAESFHPKLHALTGTAEEIADVASGYRVYNQKVESEELSGYLMDHSAFTYLMNKNGKYITHFNHNQPASDMVSKLREYL